MKLELDVLQTFKTSSVELDRITDFAARKILVRIHQKTSETKRNIQQKINDTQSEGNIYLSRTRIVGHNPKATANYTSENVIYHIASRRKNPPNEDTGHLRTGVKTRLNIPRKFVELSVKPTNEPFNYAPVLEFSLDRPFFYNTINQDVKKRDFKKAIRQVMYAIRNEMAGKLLEKKIK